MTGQVDPADSQGPGLAAPGTWPRPCSALTSSCPQACRYSLAPNSKID